MHSKKAVVLGLAAAVLAAAGVAPARSSESESSAARSGLSRAAASVKDSMSQWLETQRQNIKSRKAPPVCPPGTHPSEEGEHGRVCRSDKPASVTCEIIGYEPVTDDSGTYYKPILGKCDPEGGFAGAPRDPKNDPPQAP